MLVYQRVIQKFANCHGPSTSTILEMMTFHSLKYQRVYHLKWKTWKGKNIGTMMENAVLNHKIFWGGYILLHERELDEWQSPCSKRCLQRWPQNPSELPSALLHRKEWRYHATVGFPFRFAKASSVFSIIVIHWCFRFILFPHGNLYSGNQHATWPSSHTMP